VPETALLAPSLARLRLRFGGFHVELETNSLRAASRLETYFSSYLDPSPRSSRAILLRAIQGRAEYDEHRLQPWAPPVPGRRVKESYYDYRGTRFILKNRTGMLITLREDEARITGAVDRYLNQVVNLVNTLFGISVIDQGYAMVHASAVARAGTDEISIFLGNSGSGKSSVALQLIERGGYDFVSNDRVLLRATKDGVHVIGMPKKPRVNPGTLLASEALARLVHPAKRPRYQNMPPGELWMIEDKTDVDVTRTLGAAERLEGRLARAYSLEWKHDGRGLDVAALDAPAALAAMHVTRKDFGCFDLAREARDMDGEFARVAAAADFVRVEGRTDPAGLAAMIAAKK
jgi:HprK-related kinase B